MDDLKPLAVFAQTVDEGSMSAAARRLGMSPSAVSQTIRTLESNAGVTLLHRSTRKLSLTEAGERFYPHCKRVLEAARSAAESLQQARDAPTGELRVSAPVGFANHIAPALAGLLTEAPQLRLRLLLDDAMIDLIDARIDVAVRVGELDDSSWVARHLCDMDMILCASPAYLERHGVPAAPNELPQHRWLGLARTARFDAADADAARVAPTALTRTTLASSQAVSMQLQLRSGDDQRHRMEVQARIASNNQLALQHLCEHGLGIALLARAEALSALKRSALVHVLPTWRLDPLPVWAVTPRREGEEAKVRAAMDYLKRYFATLSSVAD